MLLLGRSVRRVARSQTSLAIFNDVRGRTALNIALASTDLTPQDILSQCRGSDADALPVEVQRDAATIT
jgi:hypothetical protein